LAYDISDPGGLALGKTELFYFFPRSDRSIHIPYNHIATIEETSTARKKYMTEGCKPRMARSARMGSSTDQRRTASRGNQICGGRVKITPRTD
jgi:hypothetical protein